jgi:hypothetical protein
MSLWAKASPYLPDFEITPMALAAHIRFLGNITKALTPASFLNPSNSTGLKLELLSCSHNPKNSIISEYSNGFLEGNNNRIKTIKW